MNIRITTDSTCDLSAELLERYNIGILPLYIQLGEKSLKDSIDIQPQTVCDYFEKEGVLAKTAAVSVGEYYVYFKKLVEEGYYVIHINISNEFSVCHQNAYTAAKEISNVTVIDSKNLSTGQGHIVLAAAKMAEAGASPKEIEEAMEDLSRRVDASFLLDTLTYLHKGGRCSALTALGANLLKLKPCIEVVDGKMTVGKKYRGDLLKCYKQYIKDRLTNIERLENDLIFITHSPCREDIVTLANNDVKEYHYFKSIENTSAGCTITGHCGPNTLGILYIRKN